jgi:hypothetical protein
MNIIDKIKSLSDAYVACGLEREANVFTEPKSNLQVAANSFIDAIVLTSALNEGIKPHFLGGQKHWKIEWFLYPTYPGGPEFNFKTCDFIGARDIDVSAYLLFLHPHVAKYAATTFPEVYMPFMTFPKTDN